MKSSPWSPLSLWSRPGRCHLVITVSTNDRTRQDSPLCDRHLLGHVRAVNHCLNGKPLLARAATFAGTKVHTYIYVEHHVVCRRITTLASERAPRNLCTYGQRCFSLFRVEKGTSLPGEAIDRWMEEIYVCR